MRAARITGAGRVELVELPDPKPEAGEVLVRVLWAAVCATDRKLTARGVAQPRVPGHEIAGMLDDGTVVGVHPDIPCGRCRQCGLGWGNRCPSKQAIGIERDGGFAEALVVPAAHAVPVPDVEPELIALLEPLACCLHAVDLLDAGARRAVVVGAGAMGILGMWALQARGAGVAVCSRDARRRALAVELGADAAVSPDEDPAEALGGAVDAALVTAPGDEPLAWAAARLDPGGALHVFAGSPGGAAIEANVVHYRHLRLVGSTGSRLADYTQAHALVASGAIELGKLPHGVIALDALPATLTTAPTGQSLRTLVNLGGEPR